MGIGLLELVGRAVDGELPELLAVPLSAMNPESDGPSPISASASSVSTSVGTM